VSDPLRFVILCLGRTGSTHLQSMLDFHSQARCHAEIFGDGKPPTFATSGDDDPKAFLDRMLAGGGERAVGFKLPINSIELTPEGRADPLFEDFPDRFHVQLGHNDRVSELGPGWLDLASSELCPTQAIRLAGKPVYGTQFHSEMDEERLRERILVFLNDYVPDEATHRGILWRLRPSIEADRLLQLFLERYA